MNFGTTTEMHGLTMSGLQEVAEETCAWGPNQYLQINYDRSTGELWSDIFPGYAHNSWNVYHDTDVLFVCFADGPMNVQYLADMVLDAVKRNESSVQGNF